MKTEELLIVAAAGLTVFFVVKKLKTATTPARPAAPADSGLSGSQLTDLYSGTLYDPSGMYGQQAFGPINPW